MERPKATFSGVDLYKNIFEKAAVLIQSLILNHPFDDGNKRTTIVGCARFLHINGWRIDLPKKRTIKFTLDINSHKLSLSDSYLAKKHSNPKFNHFAKPRVGKTISKSGIYGNTVGRV